MTTPDTNQASEDELRETLLDKLAIIKFEEAYKWLFDVDKLKVDLWTKDLQALIRTEKLKAQTAILQEGISESKEFCGEDVDINLGWVSFKLNELQQSLNKLEAEL